MAKSFQTHCGCCGRLHQLYFGMYVMFFSLVQPETKDQIFFCHINLKREEGIWPLIMCVSQKVRTLLQIFYIAKINVPNHYPE